MLSKLVGRKETNHLDWRRELKEVKDRLSKVEKRVSLLDAQVQVMKRGRA